MIFSKRLVLSRAQYTSGTCFYCRTSDMAKVLYKKYLVVFGRPFLKISSIEQIKCFGCLKKGSLEATLVKTGDEVFDNDFKIAKKIFAAFTLTLCLVISFSVFKSQSFRSMAVLMSPKKGDVIAVKEGGKSTYKVMSVVKLKGDKVEVKIIGSGIKNRRNAISYVRKSKSHQNEGNSKKNKLISMSSFRKMDIEFVKSCARYSKDCG